MRRGQHKSSDVLIIGPDLSAVGGVSTYSAMLPSVIGNRAPRHLSVRAPGRAQSSGWAWRDTVYHLGLLGRVARQSRRVAVVHVMVTSRPTALARELSVILTARLCGGTVLGHFHGSKWAVNGRKSFLYRCMLRSTLHLINGGAVLSPTLLDDLLAFSPAIDQKMAVLENPVSDAYFGIREATTEPGPFRVLCLGEVGERKGQLELMDVVNSSGAPIQLVLGGPVAPGVETRFEEALSRSERTRYVGLAKGEALLTLFRETDCYCLFSSAEAMPISILEAMAAGVPVVATAVGAVAGVVTPDTGVIVAPGDRVALAQALDRLQADRPLCLSMGVQATSLAQKRFSLGEHLEKLSAIYDDMAKAS
jgi:glycosyltransferase involved in cell wall biosynthesis